MSDTRDVTRRDAVKLATAATVATAAASRVVQGAPAIQKVKAANDQVQYGFIGTGSRGSYLLKHLAGIDSGKCLALCDLNDEHLNNGAQTIGGNPRKYKDYRELLSQKDIDAVLIATPLFQHFPITKDALLAGKHTFCEKSLVFKPEEVHQLRALANERNKQVLQVGLQRRYSQYYQMVKQMVDKGELGQVTHIHAQWHRNTFAKDPWNKPVPPGSTDEVTNWRKFRKFSGGLTAELASHQIDVSDWMIGEPFEYVVGVGGHDYIHDGRDIFDNIQLIYKYPKGQKLTYSSITTNQHLSLFGASRTEFGEVIMGTAGSVEITVGTDVDAPVAIWYREPAQAKPSQGAKKEAYKAGATMVAGAASKGIPIMLSKDQMSGNESFLEREMKFGRRWLYSKGVMVPQEDHNPVDAELDGFFTDIKRGGRPKADLEVGLADSTAVILSNIAMEQERKVAYNEINTMGGGPVKKTT